MGGWAAQEAQQWGSQPALPRSSPSASTHLGGGQHVLGAEQHVSGIGRAEQLGQRRAAVAVRGRQVCQHQLRALGVERQLAGRIDERGRVLALHLQQQHLRAGVHGCAATTAARRRQRRRRRQV